MTRERRRRAPDDEDRWRRPMTTKTDDDDEDRRRQRQTTTKTKAKNDDDGDEDRRRRRWRQTTTTKRSVSFPKAVASAPPRHASPRRLDRLDASTPPFELRGTTQAGDLPSPRLALALRRQRRAPFKSLVFRFIGLQPNNRKPKKKLIG